MRDLFLKFISWQLFDILTETLVYLSSCSSLIACLARSSRLLSVGWEGECWKGGDWERGESWAGDLEGEGWKGGDWERGESWAGDWEGEGWKGGDCWAGDSGRGVRGGLPDF